MIRAATIFVAIVFLAQYSYGQDDPENTSYTDPKLGAVVKVRPLSWLSGYVMAGMEIPIGKNHYFDLNVGIPNVGVERDQSGPGGLLVRSGIKIPMRHTSPYSIFYWMPEFNYGKYFVKDFYCYNCSGQAPQPQDIWGTQWGILIDFGYRHVNPATFFFFEGGLGIGYGGMNHSYYDLRYNQAPFRVVYAEDSKFRGAVTSAHFTIGKALRRKTRK